MEARNIFLIINTAIDHPTPSPFIPIINKNKQWTYLS